MNVGSVTTVTVTFDYALINLSNEGNNDENGCLYITRRASASLFFMPTIGC